MKPGRLAGKPDVREVEELPPLKVEEEEEKESEEVVEPPKIVEEKPMTYRVGEHVIKELVAEGQDVTWIRCIKCEAEAPLTRIAELKEKPCRRAEAVEEGGKAEESVERNACELCGREGVIGEYPIPGPSGLIPAKICSECLSKYEEFCLRARPSLTVQHGSKKTMIRGRHPLEGGRGRVAWVQELSTWFTESMDHRWPCPICGEAFDRFADTVRHFMDKHPEKPGWERIYVGDVGYVSRTWQGLFCPRCGLFLESEEELRRHMEEAHGR